MKKAHLLLLSFLLPLYSYSQVGEVNFIQQNINFSSAPRTALNPMSIKLWDNYNNGGPTAYGTVMEIYGLNGHQTGQLYFAGWDNSKIRYREAFYNQNTWSDWITLLDSKNDVQSNGRLIIGGTGNHLISGNLSIGSPNPTPGALLTVGGMVSCREVKVAVTAGADHVFNEDYKLKELGELENFIKTNKHLPEIASEKEMKSSGLNMNEFQIKLLQKIEELTLYTIEQNKKINRLEEIIVRNKLK